MVDALRYRPHPSHFSLADALVWIERLKPRRAILTNLHADLDYEVLRQELPPQVEPGFDGMTLSRARISSRRVAERLALRRIPQIAVLPLFLRIRGMFHNMSYANRAMKLGVEPTPPCEAPPDHGTMGSRARSRWELTVPDEPLSETSFSPNTPI